MPISRIFSLIVAGVYLVVSLVACLGGEQEALKGVVYLLSYLVLPIACIWYGDEMGSWTGTMRLHGITSASPGCIVVIMGWILLILPVVAGIIMAVIE